MKSKVTAYISADTLRELRAVVARFSDSPWSMRVSTFVEAAIRDRLDELRIIYGDTEPGPAQVKRGRPPKPHKEEG